MDLELDSDRAKLESDPERFFEHHSERLICLDEIQMLPDLFKTLRHFIDRNNRNAQFLILGSASRDLIQQSGETLAGRISYLEISPFNRLEITKVDSFFTHWLRGGYPLSYLASSDEHSYQWRQDYIQSFLERDIPKLGFNIPSITLKRFWTMLAHQHEEVLNATKLASAMGVSSVTIRRYIDILEETFLLRVLRPYSNNLKKRLVKSPKIYIRDTGLLHALLKIESFDELLSHPVLGVSFEAFVIENLVEQNPKHDPHFYRDSEKNEIDLILTKGKNHSMAFEIKAATKAILEKGFWNALNYLKPNQTYIISQNKDSYPIKNNIWVHSIDSYLKL